MATFNERKEEFRTRLRTKIAVSVPLVGAPAELVPQLEAQLDTFIELLSTSVGNFQATDNDMRSWDYAYAQLCGGVVGVVMREGMTNEQRAAKSEELNQLLSSLKSLREGGGKTN